MKLTLIGSGIFLGIASSVIIFGNLAEARSYLKVPSSEKSSTKKIAIQERMIDKVLADGFDFPFGDKDGQGGYTDLKTGKKYSGWYIATKAAETYYLGIHTGEDWNGNGGGDSDLGQPVFSTATGKVLFADTCASPWGNCILIEHTYLENGKFKTVFSQYSHLKELKVKKGATVKRRELIGTIGKGNMKEYPAHLHFEIRKESMREYEITYWPSSNDKDVAWVKAHYEDPSTFIQAHRKLTHPPSEEKLLLLVKNEYKGYYFENGKLAKKYEIALGQEPKGAKQIQGDLKVPEGEYRIVEKTVGPFDAKSDWSKAYLGTRWMRLNYPNRYDARRGLKEKLISKTEHDAIVNADKNQKTPPKTTKLGGGIGIHGWLETDWDAEGDRDLTWGCISMRKAELQDLYDKMEVGTKVIITE